MIQLLFPALWSAALTAAVTWHFTSHGWLLDSLLITAITPYFFGAFLGGWLTLRFTRLVNHNQHPTTRFAFFFSCLTILTLGFTSSIFVAQYLVYFSQWHADVGSMMRVYQTIFTGLGSLYLMAITGLRPLLPWGLVLLFIASVCFSRGWLTSAR